jgi:hypothetical protein
MEVVLVKLLINNLIDAVWHLVQIAHERLLTQNRGWDDAEMQFQPQNSVQKIVYNPYSFVLAKTALRSNVVCRCLPKSSDTGVVANTKGEEMMTSCCRTTSFASCACCSALSLYQALIPWKDRGGESLSSCKHTRP